MHTYNYIFTYKLGIRLCDVTKQVEIPLLIFQK